MGAVELLSREGEIAIAKRIEAGREAMIAGLCESPLTFQAIIIWRDELNEGKIFLRDIIDLEATYAGPDAQGGTLFLDEVAELPMAAQAKLLRVLQEGEIERVGGETTRKVNVRLVAATNVDLEQAVRAGRFRRDLMYRLNVYPICIPALRERHADIELLAQSMLVRFCALHNTRLSGFGERALQALQQHDWPGNVRELENLVERGVILASQGGMVEVEHLFPNQPEAVQTGLDARGQLARLPSAQDDDLSARILDSGSSLEEIEARVLDHAVARARGNLSEAARLLGLTRPQLAYRQKHRQAAGAGAQTLETKHLPGAL